MEEIEILDEDFLPLDEAAKQPEVQQESEEKHNLIELDRLFSLDEDVIDVYEENLKKEEIRQKRITKIQIGLIVFLVVIATITYFFGYNIVEPFIKID